jgi:hypothetical protein
MIRAHAPRSAGLQLGQLRTHGSGLIDGGRGAA